MIKPMDGFTDMAELNLYSLAEKCRRNMGNGIVSFSVNAKNLLFLLELAIELSEKEIERLHCAPSAIGCICPPGANKDCERLDCPRKAANPYVGEKS